MLFANTGDGWNRLKVMNAQAYWKKVTVESSKFQFRVKPQLCKIQ